MRKPLAAILARGRTKGVPDPRPRPLLAIAGETSLGAMEAVVMRNAASDVRELVVPGAGHWLMEEAPGPTIAAIRAFLAGQ